MPTLPNELIRPIIGNAGDDKEILLLIITISRVFQAEGEHLLWSNLVFRNSKHLIKACRTILATPRFTPLVQSFNAASVKVAEHELTGMRNLLNTVFQQLTNLMSLSILHRCTLLVSLWRYYRDFFCSCTFKLTCLECNFRLDNNFVNFLSSQSLIIHFRWNTTGKLTNSFLPELLPNLSVYDLLTSYYPYEAAIQILFTGNHPIAHMQYLPSCRIQEVIQGLALLTVPV
jgi:hypothetical protein